MATNDSALARAQHELDLATDLARIDRIVRAVGREVTGAPGVTFVLRDGDQCFSVDEDAISPLWRGQRFPVPHCLSGWAILHDETAIVTDVKADQRVSPDAYLSPSVRSVLMVPAGRPAVGGIAAYWRVRWTPQPDEVRDLERLGGMVGVALGRVGLEGAPWAPSFVRNESNAPEPW